MSLIRWPGGRSGLSALQHEVNRLFEDLFRGGGGLPRSEVAWGPAVDVTETPETLVVETELPGVDPKEVEVAVVGDTLTIRGRKESKKEAKDAVRHVVERAFGSFSRTVVLPSLVDTQHVAAEAKDGILTITLPKSQVAKPHRIQVKTD
jgi:HSP20 family protein